MEALRVRFPGCRFSGIGGDAMEKAGLASIIPFAEMNVVGFWEVVKRYRSLKRVLDRCHAMLRSGQFDAFIPVDYPGFNLRLAQYAKSIGAPVYYYIAPQLWAWGAGRANKLRSRVDLLMVVFPFEREFFQGYGIPTVFVGHPLLDDPQFQSQIRSLDDREPLLALLPGSRTQEVEKNLPVMLAAAKTFRKRRPDLRIAVAISPNVERNLYAQISGADPHIVFATDSRVLMRQARAGIVKTGTSTLEAALCGLPFVMMYKTSALSYQIAKRLVKLPSIALANIIAGKQIVRELIQREAAPDAISDELERIFGDRDYAAAMQQELTNVRVMLGKEGAANCAADHIGRLIEESHES